jgi:hypothetical protein
MSERLLRKVPATNLKIKRIIFPIILTQASR